MSFKKILAAVLALTVIISFAGCLSDKNNADKPEGYNANMFTDNDKKTSYDENAAVSIELSASGIKCSSDSVAVDGSSVTIKNEGAYILSGTLSDGSIIVDSTKNDKIRLILDGVSVNSSSTAAIYVKQADKVFVTLADNTENTLSVSGGYVVTGDDNIDSVIFSKDDLTFNGNGNLTINAGYGHGIVSKDDLVFTGGNYTVTAASHAISGKDSVRISDGSYKLTSGKDGIHADNSDDTSLGFLYIENGSFDITAKGDGTDSSNYTEITGGTFNIFTGEGSANAVMNSDNSMPGFFSQQTNADADTVSTKGIKASGNLVIRDGTFNIDSEDDAIHSNSSVKIQGGDFTISTGDDGIHADADTSISNGIINITKSYEGIEGQTVNISGGNITLTASDDGINAAGGNDESGFGGRRQDMFASDSNCHITISGGVINIDASGDGIDSNGDLTVSGGEIYVDGPENGGNGALDYNGNATITGGTIVACGMSQMAQNFGDSSTQCSIMVTTQSSSGGDVILQDSDGNTLLSYSPKKSYNNVVISCPAIAQGETYTITASGETSQITMSSVIYGSSGGMGGGFGGPGGMGGGPGGGRP